MLLYKMHYHRPPRNKVISLQSQKSEKAISPFSQTGCIWFNRKKKKLDIKLLHTVVVEP